MFHPSGPDPPPADDKHEVAAQRAGLCGSSSTAERVVANDEAAGATPACRTNFGPVM